MFTGVTSGTTNNGLPLNGLLTNFKTYISSLEEASFEKTQFWTRSNRISINRRFVFLMISNIPNNTGPLHWKRNAKSIFDAAD